jgi:RND family efflux transporter MFP subunit
MATFVENFAEVATGQEIVRLVDTSLVEMEVSLPERMMVELKNVNEIVVVFDLFPNHEILARIKERGDEASAVTRTFPVTLIMDPPDDVMILPGMAGEATFRVRNRGQIGEGVIVPPSAVASDRYGRNYVFVLDPKASEVYQRGVEVEGLADDGMILRQGLKAGERVVTAGVHYLTEGQKVEVMK